MVKDIFLKMIFVCNLKRYEGFWTDDEPDGEGKEIMDDGNIYEGSFKKGKKSGEGMVIFKDGSLYKGNFKNGCFDGMGIMKSSTLEYNGEWK